MKKIVSRVMTYMMMLAMVCTMGLVTTYAASPLPVVSSKQVSIKKNVCTISSGNKAEFMVKQNGKKIIAAKCKWGTSNKKIVAVTPKGIVTAKAEGTATISCSYKNQTTKIKVTVKATKLTKASVSLAKGKTSSVTAMYGKTKINPGKCSWSTSNKNVATVSNGRITARKAGTAYIFVTYAKSTAKLKVTVTSQTSANKPGTTGSSSYVCNISSKKFHKPSCVSVGKMKNENKKYTTESRSSLIAQGYVPCKNCNP